MRTLRRDTRPLYVCKRIPNSEPVQFGQPKKVMLNTVATTSESDLVAFGDSFKEYRRAKISINQMGNFNEGDRAYIFVEPPIMPDPLCSDCDFEIKSVSDSVSQATILFKRLQIGKN